MTPEEIKKTAFEKIFASRLPQKELRDHMLEKAQAVSKGDYSLLDSVVVVEYPSKKQY